MKGVLSEKQMKNVEEGQMVTMYSSLHDQTYTGSIESINSYPQNEIGIDKETMYSFVVQFDEWNEELLPGAKLDMTVVIGELIDVPVVASESIFKTAKKTNVYQLSSDGTVKKQPISKGLSFEGRSEVKEGLVVGDIIVSNPNKVTVSGSTFITPMKKTILQKQSLKQMSKRQLAKYTLMGML